MYDVGAWDAATDDLRGLPLSNDVRACYEEMVATFPTSVSGYIHQQAGTCFHCFSEVSRATPLHCKMLHSAHSLMTCFLGKSVEDLLKKRQTYNSCCDSIKYEGEI